MEQPQSSSARNASPKSIKALIPLDLSKLSSGELKVYSQLIDSSLWASLEGKDPWGVEDASIIAVGALDQNNTPVGIALASYYPVLSWATLVAFHLQTEFCLPNALDQLLNALEELLRARKCLVVNFLYSTNAPMAENIEAALKRAGWDEPYLMMVRCHFDVQGFNPSWYERYRRVSLPPSFQLFPWNELKDGERHRLYQQQQQGTFPSSVSPFHSESKIHFSSSVGMRYKGEVIGWLITSCADPDTVNFSSFYVEGDYRFSKVAISLLIASIERLKSTEIPKAILDVNLWQVDQHWIDFVKKRLVPQATLVERLCESSHRLSA